MSARLHRALDGVRRPDESVFLLHRTEAGRNLVAEFGVDLLTGGFSVGGAARDVAKKRQWLLLTNGTDARIIDVQHDRVAAEFPAVGWEPERRRVLRSHVQDGWRYRITGQLR